MNEAYDCSRVVEIEDEPRHHLVLANQWVRVFAVDVLPHTRTLCHHHPQEYLLYVARGSEVISVARGEDPKTLTYADGECELLEAGLTHVVENLGDGPFKNVVVELMPAARGLRRGAEPAVVAGEAKIEPLMQKQPGAVFNIELNPAAELEIAGPAVLSSPHGDKVMVRELDEFDIPLNDFSKPMWVCAPRSVGIRNSGSAKARVVAFQLGIQRQ